MRPSRVEQAAEILVILVAFFYSFRSINFLTFCHIATSLMASHHKKRGTPHHGQSKALIYLSTSGPHHPPIAFLLIPWRRGRKMIGFNSLYSTSWWGTWVGRHQDLVLFYFSILYHTNDKTPTFLTKLWFPPIGKTEASLKGTDVGRTRCPVQTDRGDAHPFSSIHPRAPPAPFGLKTPLFAGLAPPFVIPGQRLWKAVVN